MYMYPVNNEEVGILELGNFPGLMPCVSSPTIQGHSVGTLPIQMLYSGSRLCNRKNKIGTNF